MPRGVGTSFSLFGIPVRVMSSFWIIAVLFGLSGATGAESPAKGVAFALVWAAIVFVSIVLHELGHALTALAFGAKPAITLHAMGGLTHYQAGRMSRAESWLVSFAGPAVGLMVGIAVYLATHRQPLGREADEVVRSILWVNIGWSLINLLPVVPFDGGHMMAAALGPRRATLTAVISASVGVAVAVAGFFYFASPWIALLFGSAAVNAMRQVGRLRSYDVDRKAGLDAELVKIRAAVIEGKANEVLAASERIMSRARTPAIKNDAVLALAWAHATLGRAVSARELLEKLERDAPVDAYLLAAVEDALGSPEAARARLEAARQQGLKDPEAMKLLIDLYARDGQLSRAVEVAIDEIESLGRDAARAVLDAAMVQGAYHSAADLAACLVAKYGEPSDAVEHARASALAEQTRPPR